jgi:hypothetical protein
MTTSEAWSTRLDDEAGRADRTAAADGPGTGTAAGEMPVGLFGDGRREN